MTKLRKRLNFKIAVALLVMCAMLTVFTGVVQARPLMPGDPEVRIVKFQIGSQQYTTQDGTNPVQTHDMDTAPFFKTLHTGLRVMLPFRFVGEAMGASRIEYLPVDPRSHPIPEVIIERPIMTPDDPYLGPGHEFRSQFIVEPGTKKVNMNMKELPEMDVATEIINGRTFIPLRAAAQGLGGLVFWDSYTQTVTIKTINIPIPSAMKSKQINGKGFFSDRVTVTTNSKDVVAEYLVPDVFRKITVSSDYPIITKSPGNSSLYVADPIQVFKSLFGPVSDKQILVDPVNKAVMLANGYMYRPYAQMYITSTGEGDYWIGPVQVRSEQKQTRMFDTKAYMTPDGRILTDLTGFDLAHAVFDRECEIQSFNGTTLVEKIF